MLNSEATLCRLFLMKGGKAEWVGYWGYEGQIPTLPTDVSHKLINSGFSCPPSSDGYVEERILKSCILGSIYMNYSKSAVFSPEKMRP